jgi:hypothetical protein
MFHALVSVNQTLGLNLDQPVLNICGWLHSARCVSFEKD